MKENYLKLVSEVLPDELIREIANKTSQQYKKVEDCCLEIIARSFGDGSDLTKEGIIERLKHVASNEQLKELLKKLNEKYNITSDEAGAMLTEIIPLVFKRVTTLESNNFDDKQEEIIEERDLFDETREETLKEHQQENVVEPVLENNEPEFIGERHEAIALAQEEIKEDIVFENKVDDTFDDSKELQNINTESSVDDIFANIEKKAEIHEAQQVIRNKKAKKPLFNFKKKEKKNKEETIIETPIVPEVIEKGFKPYEIVCMVAVGVAIIGIITAIVILFIKMG